MNVAPAGRFDAEKDNGSLSASEADRVKANVCPSVTCLFPIGLSTGALF